MQPGQADTFAIEVTPAMIEAGLEFLSEWDSEFYDGPFVSPVSFVAELFSIMASADLKASIFATASA